MTGQRIMQGQRDVFLGWTQDHCNDQYCYVRQLKDSRLAMIGADLADAALPCYATLCGSTLARAHARSGDAARIAGYMGSGGAFDAAIAEFAMAYAGQVERDWRLFVEAIKAGVLEARTMIIAAGERHALSGDRTTIREATRARRPSPSPCEGVGWRGRSRHCDRQIRARLRAASPPRPLRQGEAERALFCSRDDIAALARMDTSGRPKRHLPAPSAAGRNRGRMSTAILTDAQSRILPALDRAALIAVLLTPLLLLHAHGIAEAAIAVTDACFLARSAIARDWTWLRAVVAARRPGLVGLAGPVLPARPCPRPRRRRRRLAAHRRWPRCAS